MKYSRRVLFGVAVVLSALGFYFRDSFCGMSPATTVTDEKQITGAAPPAPGAAILRDEPPREADDLPSSGLAPLIPSDAAPVALDGRTATPQPSGPTPSAVQTPRGVSATQKRPAVGWSGRPKFSTQAAFELDPGVQAPAALAVTDPALGFSPAQEKLKQEITAQFLQEMDAAATDPTGGQEAIAQAWATAQKRADERFRLMFGDAAFQKQSKKIARESFGLAE